jgi:ligand-binding sensor domain-containing protein
MKKIFFLVFIFLFLINASFSQNPFFKFHNIGSGDQNLRINKLYQDKKGFIWIGTSEGLFMFNGLGFKNYFTDSVLQNNQVSAIFEDDANNLWTGYSSGKFGILQNDSLINFEIISSAISAPVTDIQQTNNGALWIATYGEGIYIYKNNNVTNLTNTNGLSDNYVYVLYKSIDNIIYAGTDRGISVCKGYDDSLSIKILASANGLPDNIVQEIVGDLRGNLWIGMQDAGVCLYDVTTGKFQQSETLQSWSYGEVTSIVVSHDELWIGTSSHGIIDYEFEGDLRFRPFNRSTGHDFNRINDMLKSTEGNIFIASNNELIQSPGERLEFLSSFKNSSINNVHAVLADKERNIWFSTDEGLFHYIMNSTNNADLNNYFLNTPFSNYHFISLYQDCHGRIWAGTFDNGVVIFNPVTHEIKNLKEIDGIINANVLSISGFDCEVWLATLGGVSKIDISKPSQFKIENYDRARGLANNYIYSVFIDSKHREWFATDGQGIIMLENGTFTNYSTKEGLKSDVIYSITEDRKGNIWFSTSTAGIYRFDGKEFKNYAIQQGIRDLSIAALISDEQGNIVIVHRKGIDLINTDTEKVTTLGIEADIRDLNPDLNVVTKDNKGNIWIGTQNGLIKYAGHFPMPGLKPITHINKVFLFLEEASGNYFASNENHISIDYIGLWYSNPELVTYQYMLEGYTRDWVNTKDHFVTFSNLSPGNYTFKIRSALGNDFENSSIKEFNFTIKKPFYANLWFILLAITTLGVAALFIVRYRERKLKERENIEKEKIEFQFETLKSQVNPHFLFNSFNTLINIIDDDKDLAVQYVEKLSTFFRNIVKYRNQHVVTLEEELSLVENYLFLQQKRYGNNLILCVSDTIIKNKYCIPPLTLQLLIENAIKHNAISRDKHLTIKIYEENEYLIVENNINLKRNVETSTGFGLQNIVTRYKLLNRKEVKIEHKAEYFKVHLPLIDC